MPARHTPAAIAGQAVGLGLGVVADRLLGDPRRYHPVAGFGTVAAALEARIHRDHRAAGVAHVLLLVGGATAATRLVDGRVRGGVGQAVWTAAVTWAALGGTSLDREGAAMSTHLQADDLPAARQRLTHLCARTPDHLDADELATATVESLAENAADAVVAPLLWGALAGPAGVVAHRTANTLDAMVGYRTDRHRRFGWAAARTDDLLNLAPARGTAALAVAVARLTGLDAAGARRAWLADGHRHPSPNAGRVEAAFAGALGLRLNGSTNDYGGTPDARPTLGDGHPPTVADIDRTRRLGRHVTLAAAVLAVAVRATLSGIRRRTP